MRRLLRRQGATSARWAYSVGKQPAQPYIIETWREDHDVATFHSGMARIDRYIHEQAGRDMSSHSSLVFVLTEPDSIIVRAYYTLSSLGVVFTDLPPNVQKKLPRYPQVPATLLGRLGVDKHFSRREIKRLGEKPRIGELLLVDAQLKTIKGATETSGTALLVIDAKKPTGEELASGLRDPLEFYLQYGFQIFPGNSRRLFKPTRLIEREFKEAGAL